MYRYHRGSIWRVFFPTYVVRCHFSNTCIYKNINIFSPVSIFTSFVCVRVLRMNYFFSTLVQKQYFVLGKMFSTHSGSFRMVLHN